MSDVVEGTDYQRKDDIPQPKCSYCKTQIKPGGFYKYSYGMPGLKNVFKCDRWWCTSYQKTVTRLRRSLPWKIYRAVKQAIQNHG